MRYMILSILLCLSLKTIAADKVVCSPVKLKAQNKSIILSGNLKEHAAQVYFLKNISGKSVWIDHPAKRASASVGWSSYLRPDNWSALLLDKNDFALTCANIQPGKVEYLDCSHTISVCVSPQVKFNSHRKGSYWIAEDKSWDEVLKVVEKRGR